MIDGIRRSTSYTAGSGSKPSRYSESKASRLPGSRNTTYWSMASLLWELALRSTVQPPIIVGVARASAVCRSRGVSPNPVIGLAGATAASAPQTRQTSSPCSSECPFVQVSSGTTVGAVFGLDPATRISTSSRGNLHSRPSTTLSQLISFGRRSWRQRGQILT
jgi:hypothetical protein